MQKAEVFAGVEVVAIVAVQISLRSKEATAESMLPPADAVDGSPKRR